jgi:hypothetical protein
MMNDQSGISQGAPDLFRECPGFKIKKTKISGAIGETDQSDFGFMSIERIGTWRDYFAVFADSRLGAGFDIEPESTACDEINISDRPCGRLSRFGSNFDKFDNFDRTSLCIYPLTNMRI